MSNSVNDSQSDIDNETKLEGLHLNEVQLNVCKIGALSHNLPKSLSK